MRASERRKSSADQKKNKKVIKVILLLNQSIKGHEEGPEAVVEA